MATEPLIRWFGVFIRTAGDRILFFPAVELEVRRGGKKLTVDHITLERSRGKWYFTSPGSKRHLFGGHTRKFGDGRIGWCGITFSREGLLPPLITSSGGEAESRDQGRRGGDEKGFSSKPSARERGLGGLDSSQLIDRLSLRRLRRRWASYA